MASLRILHVEDDPLDRLLLQRWLQRAGLDVEMVNAATAAELSAALGGPGFALVFADNRLPQLDAAGVAAIVRSADAVVPIVVVSGGMTDAQREAALRAGAHVCLEKQDRDGIVGAVRTLACRQAPGVTP